MAHDAPILDSAYSWKRLWLSLLATIVASAGMWMVVAVLPLIETDFQASRASASLPYTITMIGFALGNFFVGRLIDRFGAATSLQIAAVTSTLAFVAATQAPNIATLSVIHLFLGLGAAVGFGPLMADISHWFFKQRGIAVAIVGSGNYLAGAIWPLLLADVLQDDGWRAAYLWLAVITMVMLVPLSLTLKRQVPHAALAVADEDRKTRSSAIGLSPKALALLLGCAGIACCVAMSMPQVHIVAYCVGLGYGPAVGQQMLALMLLGGGVSRVISGMIADRLGGVRTLLIGSVLQACGLALFLPWDGMASLYLISMVFGLSQGGIVPSYALIVREYMPAKEAGRWVGFVLMMTILGMALGGWASGWIYDLTGSYSAAFINGIVWNGLNIAIVVWLLYRTRTNRSDMALA